MIAVAGEVDVSTAAELRSTLRQAAGDRHRRLVVDMTDLAFIDSTGLGVLVAAREQALGQGTGFRLCPEQRLLRVFRITRLDEHFDIRFTQSSKLASLAALVGGAAWLVAVLYRDPALHMPLYYAGLGGLLLGLAGLGYAVVATAPIWLRGVVSLANTRFGYMVWTLAQDTLDGTSGMLTGGVALVIAALVGLAHSHPVHHHHHPAAAGAHRAAR